MNGKWVEWSAWSDCPFTCSGEDLIRSRSCTNPSPENNGKECEGSNSDVVSCYTAKCPGQILIEMKSDIIKSKIRSSSSIILVVLEYKCLK